MYLATDLVQPQGWSIDNPNFELKGIEFLENKLVITHRLNEKRAKMQKQAVALFGKRGRR